LKRYIKQRRSMLFMEDARIEDAVVMDKKTFRSLTSETRIKILKLLSKRNYTLTEIAKELGITKTSAKEHLDILVEGRLIEPVPSSNIWKYYTLTKDGRKLIERETPKRVVILIAIAIIGLLISVYGFTDVFTPQQQEVSEQPHMLVKNAPMATAEAMPEATTETGHEEKNNIKTIIGVFGVLLSIITTFEIFRTIKTKRSVI